MLGNTYSGDWSRGKTYEEIMGKEKALELKKLRAYHASLQKGQPKKNLGLKLKGRTFPHMFISRPSKRKGVSMIEEYGEERAKILIAKSRNTVIKNGSMRGEKNPRFNNWSSLLPYGPEFTNDLKRQIRKRDNYTCQICYKRGLPVHHKDYNKENNSTENLITLCRSCHSKTNSNRNLWIDFFKEKAIAGNQ